MLIVIDSGHGGSDPGAIGPTGLKEKDVNLILSKKLGELLIKNNIDVMYTRTNDVFIGLTQRTQLANNTNADYYISIHCNAASTNAKGTETFAYPSSAKGEQLAKAIQQSLVSMTGSIDRGVKFANFTVLRETNMPAVLVEVAFISNPEEETLLRDDAFLNKIVIGIANGILSFLGIKPLETKQEIKTAKEAIQLLVNKGILNSPDYWLKAIDIVKQLDLLFIRIANTIK